MEDEAIVGDKVITLAQVGDKDITQDQVGVKDIIQEDKEASMVAVEALDTTQEGLGEAAKVVLAFQVRIVTPWSKESVNWRGRRQDWKPSGEIAPPLPLLPTPAEESVAPDTTEPCHASAIMDVVGSPTVAVTMSPFAQPLLQLHHRDLLLFGQVGGQLTMSWPDSLRSCWTEMLTMLPTRSSWILAAPQEPVIQETVLLGPSSKGWTRAC